MQQMIKNIFIFAILGALLSACTSPGMYGELQQGKQTFSSGDYPKSFHELLPVAVYGNKDAQYAVGYMYYNGIGVTQDMYTGEVWMKRSAQQGYPPAQRAVQELKN